MTLVVPKALIWALGAVLVVVVAGGAYVAGNMTQTPGLSASSPTLAPSSSPLPSTTTAPTDTPSPNPTSSTPTTAPTPTRSVAPTASPTVAPTPTRTTTPSPAPTPVTFSRADGGSSATSGKHTGIFGIVFANATAGYTAATRRMQVTAYIPTIGSLEKPSGRAWLYNDFRAPPGTDRQAQIAGTVRWQGILAGNGAAGAGAAIKIEVKVLDGNTLVASQMVHSKEIRQSALTIGGFDDVDQENFTFAANLTAGRLYRLQIETTCNAYTGAIGTVTHCIFGPSDAYDDGFVEWTALSVRF